MSQDPLIDDLQELGLNIYEAKVYLALIEREALGTAEVAQISGVPRARTYDVLDNLVRHGLATLRPGKQKTYSAVDLDSFRQRLIADTREQYQLKEQRIEQLAQKLKEKLDKIYNPETLVSDPLQYIEVIKNPLQIHKRFQQLVADAREEILIFSKPPYAANRNQQVEQLKQQADLMARGVRVKSIYEISDDRDERLWWLERIKGARESGEEARAISFLPMKMAIFDEQIVIYTLEDPMLRNPSFTALITWHRALAKSLKILFETIWDRAKDYKSFENGGDLKI